jgi:ubiquinone/menaquinone biosynthesis C-methylase UbiE
MIAKYEEQAGPFTTLFAQSALAKLDIGPSTRVLDVATGTGALALSAAATGAGVVAIDFSAGMVARVRSHDVPNLSAICMNGEALEFPDASFDAVFSIFGVMLFPDWRAGLREMARVTRPGGTGVLAVWRDAGGAGTTLLISEIRKSLFPEVPQTHFTEGMAELSDPQRLSAALIDAGFSDPTIEEVTHDFELEMAALDDAYRIFEHTPNWSGMDPNRQAAVLAEMRLRAERDRVGRVLPIPSTALIATARRRPPDGPAWRGDDHRT